MKLSNKMRFILAVIAGQLVVSNRRRAAIEADLEAGGYDRVRSNRKVNSISPSAECIEL